jgi:hypothetical protein
MNLPSDSPRLPKWIFFLGWACLLALAWFIHDGSTHPWAGGALLGIVVCVALAAVLVALPFVADYARSQDEALDNRQRALQTLAATVASSSEQISIATAGLQKLTGITEENAVKEERLAQQIQERIGELRASIAAAKKDDSEAAARMEAAAKKILKAASELEASAARPPEVPRAAEIPKAAPVAHVPAAVPELPPVPLTKMVEIKPAVAFNSHSPFETPAPFVPTGPESPPAAEQAAAAAPAAAPSPAPEAAPPPRKRSPRKPPAAAPVPADLPLEAPAPAPAPDAAPETAEPAVSADGATRLIVTAYIGIGNRLFIRGEGPGLAWDKGVPLVFVSIGKWRWETNDASQAVRFKLYKNDEVECTALGERSVGPGAQVDLTASF